MYRVILTTFLLLPAVYGQANTPTKATAMKTVVDNAEMKNNSELPYLLPYTKISKETKNLLIEHGQTLDKLIEADKAVNVLIQEALKWNREQNNLKTGKLDALQDKAEGQISK